MPARVLGLVFSLHGSAVCLAEDGRLVRAVNLERLVRRKHAAGVPASMLGELRRHAGEGRFSIWSQLLDGRAIEILEATRLLLEYATGERDPRRAGLDLVVVHVPFGDDYREERARLGAFFDGIPTEFDVEHHALHAHHAYLSSPFPAAAILTVDGQGEDLARTGGVPVSTAFWDGTGGRAHPLGEVLAPSSLGRLYMYATFFLGFASEQEGTTMALASYGTPAFFERARDTWRLLPGGAFELPAPDDPTAKPGELAFARAMERYCPPRGRTDPILPEHKDVAFAVQRVTEEVMVHAASALRARTGREQLAMAGGVALNCVANARVLREAGFDEIYVAPNAGDCGLAAGAALFGHHVLRGAAVRTPPRSDGLGRVYSREAILEAIDAEPRVAHASVADLEDEVARRIAAGGIVGWFEGGSEFGPRALGRRSLLADPRTPASKERLDHEIKMREWFRPYCPSVLRERASEWFDLRGESPYMLLAVPVRPDRVARIPAVVHVDGTARIQTVDAATEPRYHGLLRAFERRTGIPLLLDTSFNVRGEPLVETPANAIRCFLRMGLDALAIGDYLVTRRRGD